MKTEPFAMTGGWCPQAEALLDEHHLVAVSDDPVRRAMFGTHLAQHTQRLIDAEVCPIYGRFIHGIDDLAYTISRIVPADEDFDPTVEGMAEALRQPHPHVHRRFLIWQDAEVMAGADPAGFEAAVDMLMGVAAQQEYASEDLLMLSRCVFIGDPDLARLDAFARWLHEGGEKPFWQVVSGLGHPPVRAIALTTGGG